MSEAEAAAVPTTDVAATKAKTKGALLGGLRSGALEAAVAKMEEDTAAEEEAAADTAPASPKKRSALMELSDDDEEKEEEEGGWEPPPTSLWCCTVNTPPRKRSLSAMQHPAFDGIVLLCIVLNSIAMALEDPLEDPDKPSELTQSLHVFEIAFNIIFTIEMFTKIIAMGFCTNKGTYLRSGWNVMDFIIVITSWLPYIPGVGSLFNASGLRSFRLLRPLRSISRFPGLKVLVETILSAIPQLGNILLLTSIYFITFGIVGVQLWRGAFHHRCGTVALDGEYVEVAEGWTHHARERHGFEHRDTAVHEWSYGLMCNSTVPVVDLPDECFHIDLADERLNGVGDAGFCSMDLELMRDATPEVRKQLHMESGCDPESERCIICEINPYWGLISFDNIFLAFVIIYQIVTITSWQEYMYFTQDTAGFACWIYYVLCTLIGAYFLFNLFVAVLKEKFDAIADAEEDDSRSDSDDDGEEEMPEVIVEFLEARTYRLQCPLEDMHAPETSKDLKIRLSQDKYFEDHVTHLTQRDRANRLVNPEDPCDRVLCFKGHPIDNEMSLVEAGVAPGDMLRLETSAVRLNLKRLVQHPAFMNFFTALIIINTIVLASERYRMSDAEIDFLASVNYFLTLSFTFEVMFKLLAYTPGEFGGDTFNVFDFFVVAAGLLELLSADDSGSAAGAFRAFRIFRLFRVLRVLRLISFLKPLKKIGRVVMRTLGHLGYIMSLVLLFTYIFTILGMQAFGGKLEFDGEVPRTNYNSFLDSMFTVTQVLTFDAWNAPLFDAVRIYGWAASAYFFLWILLGAFVLLNLLLVIILDSYVEVAEEMKEEEKRDLIGRGNAVDSEEAAKEKAAPTVTDDIQDTFSNPMAAHMNEDDIRQTIQEVAEGEEFMDRDHVKEAAARLGIDPTDDKLQAMLLDGPESTKINVDGFVDWALLEMRKRRGRMRSNMEAVAQAGIDQLADLSSPRTPRSPKEWNEDDISAIDNKSCGIFGMDNPLRKKCFSMSLSRKMDRTILFVIILNCFCMALDSPYLQPDSSRAIFLKWMDILFTFIFVGEMLIKIIATGFLWNGEPSYLRDSWNRLDFIIVVISCVDFILTYILVVDGDIGIMKVFRGVRCVRPLRMLTKLRGLQMLVNSLLASITSLANVFLMTMIVWLIFGILGINLFCGQFWHCTDGSMYGIEDCVGPFLNEDTLEIEQRRWINQASNFDNIGESMFALYEIMTLDEWIMVAYNGIDAVGVDKQPQYNYQKLMVVYFITFIVVCNFLFLNLFIGVIYEEYVALKTAGLRGLKPGQKAWYNVQMAVSNEKPTVRAVLAKGAATGGFKEKVYMLVTSAHFDHAIMLTILANCIVMSMSYYQEPEWYTALCDVLNYIFTLIFTVEMCLKIYALSFPGYWLEPWNRFDFVIVMLCLVDIIVSDILQVQSFSSSVFRLFRIGRVLGRVARMFRVIKEVQSLNQIFQTLVESLPALFYMGILVVLIIFIFSILGMHLFGRLKYGDVIGSNANFET